MKLRCKTHNVEFDTETNMLTTYFDSTQCKALMESSNPQLGKQDDCDVEEVS